MSSRAEIGEAFGVRRLGRMVEGAERPAVEQGDRRRRRTAMRRAAAQQQRDVVSALVEPPITATCGARLLRSRSATRVEAARARAPRRIASAGLRRARCSGAPATSWRCSRSSGWWPPVAMTTCATGARSRRRRTALRRTRRPAAFGACGARRHLMPGQRSCRHCAATMRAEPLARRRAATGRPRPAARRARRDGLATARPAG